MTAQMAERAAPGTRLIHQGYDLEPHVVEAVRRIGAEKGVHFVGFGWDEANLRRLGLAYSPQDSSGEGPARE